MRLPGYRLLGLLLLWSTGVGAYQTCKRFIHPAPAWAEGERWYDLAMFTVLYATLAITAIRYRGRRIRSTPAKDDYSGWRMPWPQRVELRFALKAIAVFLVCDSLAAGFTLFQQLRVANLFHTPTFWSEFPWHVFFLLGISYCIWRYDRRRMKLSHRIANGLCLYCGYDLRATVDRCPECGKLIDRNAIKTLEMRLQEGGQPLPMMDV